MSLSQFFKDGSGAWSSARLQMLAWDLGVLAVWAAVSIWKAELQHIDAGVLGAMGVVTAGKVTQSFSPGDK